MSKKCCTILCFLFVFSVCNADEKKVFDHSHITKDYSEAIKHEIEEYYKKTQQAYENLSDTAKSAVKKINQERKKFYKKSK